MTRVIADRQAFQNAWTPDYQQENGQFFIRRIFELKTSIPLSFSELGTMGPISMSSKICVER
jgi:hypothetical protein